MNGWHLGRRDISQGFRGSCWRVLKTSLLGAYNDDHPLVNSKPCTSIYGISSFIFFSESGRINCHFIFSCGCNKKSPSHRIHGRFSISSVARMSGKTTGIGAKEVPFSWQRRPCRRVEPLWAMGGGGEPSEQ